MEGQFLTNVVIFCLFCIATESVSASNSSGCGFEAFTNSLLYGNTTHLILQDIGCGMNRSVRVNSDLSSADIIYLDFHFTEGSVFWTNQRTVYRKRCPFSTTTSDVETIQQEDSSTKPWGIAVDSKNNHVYWTDMERSLIMRCNLDGTEKQIVISNLQLPAAIALDITNRQIYFSDIRTGTIERCDFDGSNRKVVIGTNVGTPYGLALDFKANRFYWTDSALIALKTAKIDGSDVRDVDVDVEYIRSENLQPVLLGLDISGDNLYGVSTGEKSIFKIKKNQHLARPTVLPLGPSSYGIKVIKTDESSATNKAGFTTVGQFNSTMSITIVGVALCALNYVFSTL